ncbi:EAL domain-containing protein [Thiocystis violascens]|uniref:cyclic-guanylate-specific phosphodiesterase n=1 Tax=Thiocystis violascens (strain ATCC 17096 / DSM 198 / 6111) TaxID=765911 RepID=I3Y8G1_THIV6|nr:EAL domain-containing protein [Thiocystis violascens]AFL73279.1 diguanylate cyclase (GGDEF) domain-containing protein [Thiocystis violascens DSM 198]
MSATLLIVDDVPENLVILGQLLRAAGYRVRAANRGAVALKYARLEPPPDLILLDLMMPEMDGHEVLDHLRADPQTREIPVIFVTAMDSAETETLCLEQGAADFVTKPIVASVVLARVRNQLELRRARAWLLDQNAFLETEVARRIAEVRAIQDESERKANFDDLTGLPNRNLLDDRLAQAIERSRADASPLIVLMLSLDRFKSVNAHLGRGAGDRALRLVSERLARLTATTDTLARVEGDEFILVMEADEREAVIRYAQPMLDAVMAPLRIDDHEIVLSASIGMATFPKDGDTADRLLRHATVALSKIKVAGGQGFRFYAPAMNARALERLDLERDLREAIRQGGLSLHYQPQIDLRNGQIIGAEALARWQHPRRGWVSPGDFIPVAEESGLIGPLGKWVLHEACRQNQAWQTAGLPPVTVAVNLSALQFAAYDVVDLTSAILRETGLAPEYLELELTESAAMADTLAFIEATQRLKELSISLSLDDFGTGFSSLGYLRQFRIDRLKIDQTFVNDIVQDPGSAAIVTAIINLAHSLNLAAIAEGVETEAQLQFLRAHDCDEMQGYYFSRPLPASEFEALLRSERLLAFPAETVAASRTLLLVDDDPQVRFMLERLFAHEGYRVLSAGDGLSALELLALNAVDVVVSDGDMPLMDGAEFLVRVSAMYPGTMRILLSGTIDPKLIAKSVNQGEIFKFLTKPWKTAELREAVREAFRIIESRAQRHPLALAGGLDSNPA